jgi:hypothetical protein
MDRFGYWLLKKVGQKKVNDMLTSHRITPLKVSKSGRHQLPLDQAIESHLAGMPEHFRVTETDPGSRKHLSVFRKAGTKYAHRKCGKMSTVFGLRSFYTQAFRAEVDLEAVSLVMADYDTLISRSVLADGKVSANVALSVRFALRQLNVHFATDFLRECTILYIINRLVLFGAYLAMTGLVSHESRPFPGRWVASGEREPKDHPSGS